MSSTEFITAVDAMAREVADFHERWGRVSRLPGDPSEVLGESFKILEEEVRELDAEIKTDGGDIDLRAASDEAADVLFVALGIIHRLGPDGHAAVERVVAKNRAKTNQTHFFDEARRKVTRRRAD